MEQKRMQKNSKGITLIALVITIIVLLILVGVTIATLTGDNGILTQATNAKEETGKATAIEKVQVEVLGSYGTNGGIDISTLNDNLKNNISSLTYNGKIISEDIEGEGRNRIEDLPATVKVDGYDIEIYADGRVEKKIIADRTGIAVGDYINYTPDPADAYTGLSSSNTGSSSNATSIAQDTLNWQVLRIYDDGSMDLIGSITSTPIYFQGALGYNNGVYLMNDICKTLYSKESANITARSVNVKDIEDWLTTDGQKIKDASISGGGIAVNGTKTYTGRFSYYPKLYAYEKGAGINTTDVNTSGVGLSESYSEYNGTTTETYGQASTNGLTVTQTYWDSGYNSMNETNFGEGAKALYSSTYYWVASRYAVHSSDRAFFGLCYAGTILSGDEMFDSYSVGFYGCYHLRPVVSLKSNVKITPCEGTNSTTNTHELVKSGV